MLQCEVSLFTSVFSKEAKRYTLGSILKSFASRRYAKTVREARGYLQEGDTEMYKACKSMLPVVAFSGVFEGGHSKTNLVHYNNIVIIDIDHLSEEEMPTISRQLLQDEYVFAYWKSPSGQGLKGLVRISSGDEKQLDEHHRQAFRQLTDYFKTKYSIDIDQSGSDYSRLCYACWDEGLVVKQTAKLFAVDKPTTAVPEELHQLDASKQCDSHTYSSNHTIRHSGTRLDRQSDIDTIWDIIRYLRAPAVPSPTSTRTGCGWPTPLRPRSVPKLETTSSCFSVSRMPTNSTRTPAAGYCYAHTKAAGKREQCQAGLNTAEREQSRPKVNGQTSFGTIIYLARKAGYTPDKVERIKSGKQRNHYSHDSE
jgi:hypothetical protein